MYGIAWHTLIELRMHCYNLQDQKAKKLHVFGSEITEFIVQELL